MLSQKTHTDTHPVKISDVLYQQIKKFKAKNNYADDSQAVEEIIRVGLEYLREQAEDGYLLALAEERLKNGSGIWHSADDVYKELDISADDLDEIPMEYGVDFE